MRSTLSKSKTLKSFYHLALNSFKVISNGYVPILLRSVEISNFVEFINWKGTNFHSPSPHFIKLACIKRNCIPNSTFIETGTYLGQTTRFVSKFSTTVHSIEPSEFFYQKALSSLSKYDNIKLHFGSSEVVLPQLLLKIQGDVCFWLDGHFSGGETFLGDLNTPILEELHQISLQRSRFRKIVVLIDDIRLFDSANPESFGYPERSFLIDWAESNKFWWNIEQDIFVARNFNLFV